MGFQISPGVQVNEVDLTTIVPAVSTTDGGLVGVFRWGPLNEIVLLGDESQLVDKFGKPNDDTATSFFTAANFLAYGNKLRLVRVASTATTSAVVGGTASSSGTTVTGSGTTWLSLSLRPGDLIVSGAQTKTIVTIATDTSITTDTAFSPALSAAAVTFTRYDGTLNATADGNGVLIKNDDHYDANYANGQGTFGIWAAKHPGKLGNALKVSLCPSSNAFKRTLSGTVSSTGTTVSGSSTQFATELVVGSYIKDPLSGEERKVSAIASATSLTIESAFSTNLAAGTVLTGKWEFADSIGIAPGTSDFAAARSASGDEIHVVVVDADGTWTGIKNTVLERHAFLSKASDAKSADGAITYYATAINRASKYIRWSDHLSTGTNWGSAASGVTFTAVNIPNTVTLAGGRDVNTGSAIDGAKTIGYDLFKNADEVDVSFVMLGEATTTVAAYVINNVAETRKDCLAFISPEKADVVNNFGNEVTDSITFRNTLPSSSYAVLDSGWKYQFDKYNDVYRWVPLNGDIAGLCVRTDTNSDPWFSPAGYNRGNIKNVIKLAYSPYKAQRDDLYSAGINPVINEAGQGTILFGDKTLLAKPSAFDRINVRRLFIVVEKAIARASKSSLFEINDEFTRASFRNLIEPFLRDVQGRRGIYDFRVVCDSTNNTGEVIDRGEFRGDIYIKPSRSINFITLNFVAVRTGVEFTEIVGKF